MKSKIPTSEYKVYCDTYDVEGVAKIHETKDGHHKILLTLRNGDEEISVSLWKEDISFMSEFIETALEYIDERSASVK